MTRHGTVTNETVNRILNRVVYAGMVERPEWDVSLRPGKHQGLVSFETFETIQKRLNGKAYASARPDIIEDFPLRGSLNCGDCGSSMTSCWSKSKTGKRHAYYMCFNKGCESYRKSIRRDDVHAAFDGVLEGLAPSKQSVSLFKSVFTKVWNAQAKQVSAMKAQLERKMTDADKQIEKLLERIVTASSDTVVGAYEAKIDKLERDKLVMSEKAANLSKPKHTFSEMFELALQFIANPQNYWENGSLAGRKTLLRLAFNEPLTYTRIEGFRTPETSSIFKALGEF